MISIVLYSIVFIIFNVFIFNLLRKKYSWKTALFLILYVYSLPLSLLAFSFYGEDYHTALDPMGFSCYIPINGEHFLTIVFYFIAFNVAAFFLWQRGRNLPPLFLAVCFIFIFIELGINTAFFIQISKYNNEGLEGTCDDYWVPLFYPLLFFEYLIGCVLTYKIIFEEQKRAKLRLFKNPFLNKCNRFLARYMNTFSWFIVLFLPVFMIVTLILIVFGQDYNSLIRAFTDTTTWALSQKEHPPVLEYQGGHYLCTVGAKGSPNLVKPIRLGKRHGRIIIVNRQLQIANAFEELISDHAPRLHSFIRKLYDNYGYNLSVKINNERASNITYILMKPLEWFFLVILYLFMINPEEKIKKQYSW